MRISRDEMLQISKEARQHIRDAIGEGDTEKWEAAHALAKSAYQLHKYGTEEERPVPPRFTLPER